MAERTKFTQDATSFDCSSRRLGHSDAPPSDGDADIDKRIASSFPLRIVHSDVVLVEEILFTIPVSVTNERPAGSSTTSASKTASEGSRVKFAAVMLTGFYDTLITVV
mmetsp:Transcript_4948/g.10988  ORF Transcript_4948/g.10988 Transcript_4948/m.10988 type:complete len:108 (-) Transcript_4948:77-400(-)